MSGDIEDFLRRAAERRQARQANRPAPAAAPPQRPEYSDARRERLPQARAEDDDLVIAEVVEEPMTRKLAELREAQASAQAMRDVAARQQQSSLTKRLKRAERAAAKSQVQRAAASAPARSIPAASITTVAAAAPVQSEAMFELHEALKTPHGLRNAMLLHEILARPEHRW